MASFDTIISNTLEEVHMIAGDEKIFYYEVYNDTGGQVDITSASCVIYIYRYGDPSHVIATLEGTSENSFTIRAVFESEKSIALQGVYQQLVEIVDIDDVMHRPALGKIVIFPSPQE